MCEFVGRRSFVCETHSQLLESPLYRESWKAVNTGSGMSASHWLFDMIFDIMCSDSILFSE